MFEKVFESVINQGIAIKTKYIFMVDNQGDYIYKIKTGYKKEFKNILKDLGFDVVRNKENKVEIIYKDNFFIGCIE